MMEIHSLRLQRAQPCQSLIFMAINPKIGLEEIVCAASNGWELPQGEELFTINGNTLTPISSAGLSDQLCGVWFKSQEKYIVVGAGIGIKNSLNDSIPWYVYPSGVITSYATSSICGQDTNDIMTAGSYAEITHYNGKTWTNYNSILGVNPNVHSVQFI